MKQVVTTITTTINADGTTEVSVKDVTQESTPSVDHGVAQTPSERCDGGEGSAEHNSGDTNESSDSPSPPKFKVGDKVRRKPEACDAFFVESEIYTVKRVSPSGSWVSVGVEGAGGDLWFAEYFELVIPKFKVGDKVRCVDSAGPALQNGRVYTVSAVAVEFHGVFVGVDGAEEALWDEARFEPAADHRFNVGDRVEHVWTGERGQVVSSDFTFGTPYYLVRWSPGARCVNAENLHALPTQYKVRLVGGPLNGETKLFDEKPTGFDVVLRDEALRRDFKHAYRIDRHDSSRADYVGAVSAS